MPAPIELNGRKIGVIICEDLWDPAALGEVLYESDPVLHLREQGAESIIIMSASPFQLGKSSLREEMIRRQVERTGLPIVYVNQVGGNDELVFDGGSMVMSADGTLLGRCKSFQEDFLVVDTDAKPVRCENPGEDMEQLAEALKLGLRDYLHKCQFKSVVLGLSGGIDSAVVATISAEAIGPENVLALAMPSRYSSEHSLADARRIAENLKIRLVEVPIEPIHSAYEQSLTPHLPEDYPDTTDQNIQARIRGNIIMAFSNALGYLPLATGNKSELATGYCTLYGDMSGGLALLADVPKTMVYGLARYINRERELIPQATIDKPPSAELRPGQEDADTLPPYAVLDAILHRYVEERWSIDAIVADGYERDVVEWVVRAVDRNEYKRRQAAPGIRVTSKAFGMGRRMPIAARYEP